LAFNPKVEKPSVLLFLKAEPGGFSSRASAAKDAANQAASHQFAGFKLDRTEALIDGKEQIEGYHIDFAQAGIGDLNTDVFSGPQSYNMTEIGLQFFMLAHADENLRDYQLLLIFPIRVFRHRSIYTYELTVG
jgi:4,5-dihydroxyphthalate decarboxylase